MLGACVDINSLESNLVLRMSDLLSHWKLKN